jgi:tetratricopeptide (TPR) repeat protein
MPEHLTHTAGPGETAAAAPAAPPASPPGYEFLHEIGHGGMGVVYRARDIALDRDVAVKVLADRFPPGSPPAQRFLTEARITGQLQHPGIPAVHQVGALADGRPFLAMKLIKGSTFETILKDRPDPAADRGRLLAVFEAVCQAVGYAHAHRVIHRDLKPANVMVGAFGEVQVMDWGLAKVVGEEAPAAADAADSLAAPTRAWTEIGPTPGGGSHTQAGSLIGTPAFIPPEQALGEVAKVNERADVFGLGAVLAIILTGKPPYVGENYEAVRVQAARGKLEDCFARLGACGAEPELVALCKRCLAFEPADRPADAGAVAQAVAGLRAAADERARQAELERVRVEGEQATARARTAERRKRRRLYVGGAALVAGVIIAALVALAAVKSHQSAQLQLERDAARKAEDEARSNRDEADRQRKLAQARLETAVDAVERMMVRVAGANWANRPELQQDRREVLEEAVAFFRGFGSEDSKDPLVRRQAGRAYVQAATAYLALGEYGAAGKMARAAADTFGGLAADAPRDPVPLQAWAMATSMLGQVSSIRGEFIAALEHYKAASDLAARAVDLDPKSEDSLVILAEAYSSLSMYFSLSAPPKAADYIVKTLALSERLTANPQAGFQARLWLATVLANSAAIDINQGRPKEGWQKTERARREAAVLDGLRPPSAQAAERFITTKAAVAVLHGTMLFRAGKQAEGLEEVRAGIVVLEPLVAAQPRAFPVRYQKLQHELTYADMLRQVGKLAEAEAGFARVDALRDKMLADHPSLSWLKSLGAGQRSLLLVERAKQGQGERLDAELAALVRGLDGRVAQTVKYNGACAYAQLARTAPPADRGKHADTAMAILFGLLKTPYFRSGGMADHVHVDSDLDALRGRADFQEFLKQVKAL